MYEEDSSGENEVRGCVPTPQDSPEFRRECSTDGEQEAEIPEKSRTLNASRKTFPKKVRMQESSISRGTPRQKSHDKSSRPLAGAEEDLDLYLQQLEQKMEQRKLDFRLDVRRVSDIDQRLHFTPTDLISELSDPDSNEAKEVSRETNDPLIHQTAYLRALAVARANENDRLLDVIDFNQRVSRPFTFSYLPKAPHLKRITDQRRPSKSKKESKVPNHNPTRMIFGDVRQEDYYPRAAKDYDFHIQRLRNRLEDGDFQKVPAEKDQFLAAAKDWDKYWYF